MNIVMSKTLNNPEKKMAICFLLKRISLYLRENTLKNVQEPMLNI